MMQRQQLLRWIDEACGAGARQAQACEVVGLSLRTAQRWRNDTLGDQRLQVERCVPPNQLSEAQRQAVLQLLTAPAYAHLPPSQIVPCLADEGRYLASESTMYRLLRAQKQLTHRHAWCAPRHRRPAPLVATAPNQLYSWDITYLPSTVRGVFFYLFLFLDVFSRKIVGWQVHEVQGSDYAAALLKDICQREGIDKSQVVLHSDNGGPMKGATMLAMMQDLGVIPSFSRPAVSDDNPYSEALFRTVKYAPQYPGYFASVEQARDYLERFVHWYNEEHRHSAIRFVTPAQRHRGEDRTILANRQQIYQQAKAQHPERWSGQTRNWSWINTVHLNPEKSQSQSAVLAEVA
jgi:putative transposase